MLMKANKTRLIGCIGMLVSRKTIRKSNMKGNQSTGAQIVLKKAGDSLIPNQIK